LAEAGGRAGNFKIGYVALDDSSRWTKGRWDSGRDGYRSAKRSQEHEHDAYMATTNPGDLTSR